MMEADSTVTASEHTRDVKIASLDSAGLLAQLAPCGSWPQASAKPLGHRINSLLVDTALAATQCTGGGGEPSLP